MKKDFEDIVSDTAFKNDAFADISSTSAQFKKKKHGIAGFFQRLGNGWKKLRRWKKAVIISCVAVVTAVSIAVGVFFDIFGYDYNSSIDKKPPEDLGFENVIDQKIINIALFGIDSRSKGFKGNSDSIMVLSVDTEAKTIKIVSIVRDTLVPIEQNGKIKYRKINSAYASGGPELAIKTINQNFGLDISEYATVNFNGMAEIIDAVGGIDAELVKGEVVPVAKSGYALNGCIKDVCTRLKIDPTPYYIFEPGKHHLNGIQAVAYSRIRKTKNVWGTNNDYGRTDRQRYVMEQLFNKALTLSKTEYIKLAKALLPHVQTSLSYSEIIDIGWSVMLKSPTFSQSRIPLNDYLMPGKYLKGVGDCVYYDLAFAKEILHAYFYEQVTPEDYIAQNGVKKNDWYAQVTGDKPSSVTSSNPSTSSTPDTSTPDSTTSEEQGGTTSEGTVTTPEDTQQGNESEESTPENPNDETGDEETPPENQGGEEQL